MTACLTIGCTRRATKRGGQLCPRCDVRLRDRARQHCAADIPNTGGPGSRGGRRCGTHSGYTGGCRCDACTAANTRASREYQRLRRYLHGQQPRMVDAAATRTLIVWLADHGWRCREIADACGVSESTVYRIRRLEGEVTRVTHEAVERLVRSVAANREVAA